MTNSRITVLMPGHNFPNTTISARTYEGLKNCLFLGPALMYFL